MTEGTNIENGDGTDATHSTNNGQRNANKKSFALAFSGGGIGSASFQCGVLKQLKDLKQLKNIGSLSTVSGGGYTGTAFLSHLMEEYPGNENEENKEGNDVEDKRQKAFGSLEGKMKDNVNYLFGDNLVSQLHVIAAAFLGVLYTLVLSIAVAFITASMIYADGPKIECTVPGDCTVVDVYNPDLLQMELAFTVLLTIL